MGHQQKISNYGEFLKHSLFEYEILKQLVDSLTPNQLEVLLDLCAGLQSVETAVVIDLINLGIVGGDHVSGFFVPIKMQVFLSSQKLYTPNSAQG